MILLVAFLLIWANVFFILDYLTTKRGDGIFIPILSIIFIVIWAIVYS